ncbi:hypothetical protein WEU38_07285 [Cyanobacterium aponinum AL20118]|uniref:Uncharacterized protein n=2 Tax=Cyanobacterium aponinum TaxID=379064 RepID=K9Z404_CYAAP|nr:hypothetical protein [Cyanobacterium aponinum]AFZ53300.1 hypothetical protein Cyan10605_1179 [Cyanobacterium aponinum PCC 10605]WPF90065.1 hypothetical protein SAY89_07305 [Cyanobacterium aponinum AL20115]
MTTQTIDLTEMILTKIKDLPLEQQLKKINRMEKELQVYLRIKVG